MRLNAFLKGLFLFTILGVLYINFQMNIFDLAYRGKIKEKQIRKLIEANSNLTFHVLSLQSADNIGGQLLADDSSMEFADPENIIVLETPERYFERDAVSKISMDTTSNNFMNMFVKNKYLSR